MKADLYGGPADQTRFKAGWRTATHINEQRCDECGEFADISGNGGARRIHCRLLDVASKPNATCDKPEAMVRIYRQRTTANWRPAESGKQNCAICEYCGDDGKGPSTHCFEWDFPTTKTHTCDHQPPPTLMKSLSPHHLNDNAPIGPRCTSCLHAKPCDLVDHIWCGLWNRTSPTDWDYRCSEHTKNEDLSVTDNTFPAITPATGQDIETYDRRRVVSECKFYMAQSAEAMLEAGKRLMQIKDNEPHGDFTRIVEHDLGIPYRTAARLIATSLKFSSPALASNLPALAGLGKTKLFELMTESDDDLAELAEGGTLAGKTLDEIDRMTSRELKAALRKAKADAELEAQKLKKELEAKDRRIAQRSQEVIDLKDKLDDKRAELPPDPDAVQRENYATDLLDELASIRASIDTTLRARCKAYLDICQGQHYEHGRLLVAQALGQLGSITRVLSADFDIVPTEHAIEALANGMDGELAEIWKKTQAELEG